LSRFLLAGKENTVRGKKRRGGKGQGVPMTRETLTRKKKGVSSLGKGERGRQLWDFFSFFLEEEGDLIGAAKNLYGGGGGFEKETKNRQKKAPCQGRGKKGTSANGGKKNGPAQKKCTVRKKGAARTSKKKSPKAWFVGKQGKGSPKTPSTPDERGFRRGGRGSEPRGGWGRGGRSLRAQKSLGARRGKV